MRKFKSFLFVLKQSYICYYLVRMTVPLMPTPNIFLGEFSHNIEYSQL